MAKSNLISILIVDDHEVVRNGIRSYLETIKDFDVVGEAESGEKAIKMVSELIPDIVLLDLIMPGQSGMETLSQILAIDPEACVIIVSSLGTEDAVHECLATGARSFLRKPFKRDDFLSFLRKLDVAEQPS